MISIQPTVYGLKINNATIKVFNLAESFDTFNKYLEGYASYKINNVDKENNTETNTDTVEKMNKKNEKIEEKSIKIEPLDDSDEIEGY